MQSIKQTRTITIQFSGFLMLLLILGCAETEKENTPWVTLFDGKTLNGWTQKGGNANYRVRNETIVGTTVKNTPNSFLTSSKMYGDFILELDYKVDPSINSGIQIRSNSFSYYRNGRVHGYQIEIDPSEQAWSGGIYDEARRGWLYPLADNIEAQKAFKQNQWNHYRIEAIGDTLKTWINGIAAAYLIDAKTASGFIGLQVHSIREGQTAGSEIVWKNIRIITDNVSRYAKKSDINPIITKNKLTINEKENGWQLLWDGKTTEGWRGAELDIFPKKGWKTENGELSVLSSSGAESRAGGDAGGDIVTTDMYSDFELKVDFKITKGANSGIMYYVDTNLDKGLGYSIGLEYQILDDAAHPDAIKGNHEGSRTMASLYDLIKANPNKPANPVGEWNSAYIISKNNHIEHWLNGIKVLEYERKSDDYLKLVSESKYVKLHNFGEADKGHILLQDHGDYVSFKNIKIRSINDNDDDDDDLDDDLDE